MIKKNILFITIGVLVLALLIGGAVLIKTMFGEKTQEEGKTDTNVSPTYEREGVQIYSVNTYIYEGLTVHNQYGDYTVKKNDSGFFFVGKENVPLLTASSKALYECVLNLVNESTIDLNSDRFDYYGLDNPQATLTVLKSKGENDTLLVGDKTPDGGGYYFAKSGEKAVYVVSSYFGDRVVKSSLDFYVTDLSVNFDTSKLQALSIDRENGFDLYLRTCTQAEIDTKKYESTMLLAKPFTVGANNDNARAAVADIAHLEASKIISDDITAETLAKYGLDNPVKVTVSSLVDISSATAGDYVNDIYDKTVTSETYVSVEAVYYVGATNERDTYVMFGNRKVIYAVDKDSFAFLNEDVDYFCQRLVSIKYLKELKEVDVKFDGKTYAIKTWTETDSSNNITYKASYQNAPRVGTDLQALYKLIVGVSQYGLAESPGTDSILTITLKGNDGSEQVVEFLPYEGGLYAFCRTDGSGTFRVLTSQLDKIKEATIQFAEGKTVTVE